MRVLNEGAAQKSSRAVFGVAGRSTSPSFAACLHVSQVTVEVVGGLAADASENLSSSVLELAAIFQMPSVIILPASRIRTLANVFLITMNCGHMSFHLP